MTKFWILAAIAITVLGISSIGPVRSSAQKRKHDIGRAAAPVHGRYIVKLNEDSVARNAMGPQVKALSQTCRTSLRCCTISARAPPNG